ncbi:MAG: hypothetical protein RLY31_637 [Bacteroidota bacterium]
MQMDRGAFRVCTCRGCGVWRNSGSARGAWSFPTESGERVVGTNQVKPVKKIISTPAAPAAIGPYNQAVQVNGLLFVSGQIPIDPATGTLVAGEIEAETHQVLRNIGAILAAAGSGYEQVVKASVFVKDMGHFSRINEVYATYFPPETAPARELVEVAQLPRFVNIEISVIALAPA